MKIKNVGPVPVGKIVSGVVSGYAADIVLENKGHGVVATIEAPVAGVVPWPSVHIDSKDPGEATEIAEGTFSELWVDAADHRLGPETAEVGWRRLMIDLNWGAKGKFLYFTCKPDEDPASAITDVVVLNAPKRDQIATPDGFTKIDVDLNWGAKGDYIYAFYRKGVGAPLTGLAVVAGNSAALAAPAGFTRIDVDLNRGARGKYIYLCYRKP